MTRSMSRLLALVAGSLLAGCQALAPADPMAAVAVNQSAAATAATAVGADCIGPLANPRPDALDKVDNPLIDRARGLAGKRGLCRADAFSVRSPLRVYRIWDVTRPNSAFGGWWTLSRPTESKADYRRSFGICREFNALDRLISCNVKQASTIAIGTTQSVACQDGNLLPRTDALQVFIANNLYQGTIQVEDCRDEDLW